MFRAEPHDTVRHLAEYVSLDVELGFIARPPRRDRACCATSSPGMVAGDPRARAPRRSSCSARDLPEVPEEIPVIHFREALEHRRRARRRARPGPGARAGARRVGAGASTAATSSSSRATRCAKRPFYTHPDPDDPHWSNSLRPALPRHRAGHRRPAAAPVRRLRGGAGRAAASPCEPYAAYLEAFRHGMPPHGGFAIGLERWVARLVEARQHPRGHAVPARPAPAGAIAGAASRARDGSELIGYEGPMTLIRLVARPMLASMFVVGGINALRNTEHAWPSGAKPVTDKIVTWREEDGAEQLPIPTDEKTLVRINAGVQIVGGLGAGHRPRAAALRRWCWPRSLVPDHAGRPPVLGGEGPGAPANQQIALLQERLDARRPADRRASTPRASPASPGAPSTPSARRPARGQAPAPRGQARRGQASRPDRA